MDAFAADAVVFDAAFSPVPLTLPSHTTLLTGLDPPRHSVRDNSLYQVPATAQTLAEALSLEGYDTFASVAAIVLHPRYALDQGFASYDVGAMNLSGRMQAERPAGEVTDAFLSRLSSATSPWFGFVHYYDPHHPFVAPKEFAERFTGEPERQYFAELAYADQQFGRLLDQLEETGALEHTLVVVTSDHGEGRGEHGEVTHGDLLHDATQRVPLLIRMPGHEARRVSDLVTLSDVMPTLLDALDVLSEQGMDGQSLMPLIRGESWDRVGEAYLETWTPHLAYDWAVLDAVRTPQWKLVVGSRPRLFDLRTDPAENHDVADQHPEVVEHLSQRLDFLRTREPSLAADTLTLSAAEKQMLGSIGYVPAVSGGSDDRRSDRPDTYDHIERKAELERALFHLQRNELEPARSLLEPLVADFPDTFLFREALAGCYGRMGRHALALEQFQAATQIHPDALDTWVQVALAAGNSGEVDLARDTLAWILDQEGAPPRAYFMLAELYRKERQPVAAKGVLARLLQRRDISAEVRQQASAAMR